MLTVWCFPPALQIDNPMQKAHQQYITEAWSNWGRPGLTRKQRSLLNIAILMTLGRSAELRAHTRGAIRNGLTEEEITEAITHTMMYSGVPAGVEGSKVAAGVIKEMKENGEFEEARKKHGLDTEEARKKAGQGGEEAVLAS